MTLGMSQNISGLRVAAHPVTKIGVFLFSRAMRRTDCPDWRSASPVTAQVLTTIAVSITFFSIL